MPSNRYPPTSIGIQKSQGPAKFIQRFLKNDIKHYAQLVFPFKKPIVLRSKVNVADATDVLPTVYYDKHVKT
jgi:hypothetical protein